MMRMELRPWKYHLIARVNWPLLFAQDAIWLLREVRR
jgi:hypothetical protein